MNIIQFPSSRPNTSNTIVSETTKDLNMFRSNERKNSILQQGEHEARRLRRIFELNNI